jgi:hypothetical protein
VSYLRVYVYELQATERVKSLRYGSQVSEVVSYHFGRTHFETTTRGRDRQTDATRVLVEPLDLVITG